jgi:hypothetical protein
MGWGESNGVERAERYRRRYTTKSSTRLSGVKNYPFVKRGEAYRFAKRLEIMSRIRPVPRLHSCCFRPKKFLRRSRSCCHTDEAVRSKRCLLGRSTGQRRHIGRTLLVPGDPPRESHLLYPGPEGWFWSMIPWPNSSPSEIASPNCQIVDPVAWSQNLPLHQTGAKLAKTGESSSPQSDEYLITLPHG